MKQVDVLPFLFAPSFFSGFFLRVFAALREIFFYRANSNTRVSRTTVTLISPG